jgi:hypothetical protein
MEVVDMKPFPSVLLLGSGVLVLSMAAQAQDPYYSQRDDPYYRNDPYYQNFPNQGGYNDGRYSRQSGYPDRYGDGRNQGSLIGRVVSDLNMAARNSRFDRRERKHFDEGVRQLQQFEDRWAQGRFDTGKLHEAIEELDHLAKSDRVSGRDREILARDAADVRRFRSTRGQYSNNGYRDYGDDRYNQNRGYDPNWR